ncbi:uncharacterized protein BO97DRAFT_413505 [Aspergillus homomorphus CBS 101889]|uniref:Uncharacterized protein n=1 Tax=Aspergillus homomorphus (strain CBS 101889) TaxID=1450537 RepID=A0A395I020_ASPHC|nr:hypothetical protein BO97DRAFT_413505 [Aspergillus homomorphus CBS 101889]RAL13542.1 hypothetical protein BO97DRAFT_413505 [Aspergillus homomorphus CBS 101889]
MASTTSHGHAAVGSGTKEEAFVNFLLEQKEIRQIHSTACTPAHTLRGMATTLALALQTYADELEHTNSEHERMAKEIADSKNTTASMIAKRLHQTAHNRLGPGTQQFLSQVVGEDIALMDLSEGGRSDAAAGVPPPDQTGRPGDKMELEDVEMGEIGDDKQFIQAIATKFKKVQERTQGWWCRYRNRLSGAEFVKFSMVQIGTTKCPFWFEEGQFPPTDATHYHGYRESAKEPIEFPIQLLGETSDEKQPGRAVGTEAWRLLEYWPFSLFRRAGSDQAGGDEENNASAAGGQEQAEPAPTPDPKFWISVVPKDTTNNLEVQLGDSPASGWGVRLKEEPRPSGVGLVLTLVRVCLVAVGVVVGLCYWIEHSCSVWGLML